MNNVLTETTLTIREGAFRFKREANFPERQRIRTLQAEYAGGYDKLTELETLSSTLYRKHEEYNIQKFGQTKFDEIQTLFREKKDFNQCTKEERALRIDFNNNKFYIQLLDVVEEKNFIYDVASLNVLCVEKPNGYDFNDQSDVELRKLIQEVKEANKSFRTGETKAL